MRVDSLSENLNTLFMRIISIRDLSVFLLGFGIAYALFPRERVQIVDRVVERRVEVPVETVVKKSVEVLPKDFDVTQVQAIHPEPVLQKLEEYSLKKALAQKRKNQLELSVTEGMIERLEADFDHTRNFVSTTYQQDGWVLSGDIGASQFAQAGLRDGDVIRHDSLQELKRRPDKSLLVQRLEAVLMALQR